MQQVIYIYEGYSIITFLERRIIALYLQVFYNMVNNLEKITIDKIEYAKLAHIINSKRMKKGRNTIYSDNYIYYIMWIGFDNWDIYGVKSIEGSVINNEYEKRN